jgi:hypothetical protein
MEDSAEKIDYGIGMFFEEVLLELLEEQQVIVIINC